MANSIEFMADIPLQNEAENGLRALEIENGSNRSRISQEYTCLRKTISLRRTVSVKDALEDIYETARMIPSDEILCGTKIGSGGFGNIFSGKWNGKKCALKVYDKGNNKPEFFERHLIEIGVLNRLCPHPNIIKFYGACFDDSSSPIIVEELVDGPNLEEHLWAKRQGFDLGYKKVRCFGR